MTAAHKGIAAALAVALLAGGTWYATAETRPRIFGGSSAPAVTPAEELDGSLTMITDGETSFTIPYGETWRMNFNDDPMWNTDFADVTATPEGFSAVVHLRDGTVQEMSLGPTTPEDEGMTNIQIWEEMNRAAVQSLFVELTPEGTRFNFFTRNKPELLPVLEAAEDRYATGQVSRRQLGTFVSRVLRENNMLPNNTRHREVIEAFMEREIYGP